MTLLVNWWITRPPGLVDSITAADVPIPWSGCNDDEKERGVIAVVEAEDIRCVFSSHIEGFGISLLITTE